jgi:hypothetical protein
MKDYNDTQFPDVNYIDSVLDQASKNVTSKKLVSGTRIAFEQVTNAGAGRESLLAAGAKAESREHCCKEPTQKCNYNMSAIKYFLSTIFQSALARKKKPDNSGELLKIAYQKTIKAR